MKESDVRSKLVEVWSPYAEVSCIENTAGTGMPDCNLSYRGEDLWVEIKFRRGVPKRDNTPILKGQLRSTQKVWIKRRIIMGSRNIFLFARVEEEYYLYHVKNFEALEALEVMSEKELYDRCIWYGINRQKPDWWGALDAMSNAMSLERGHD